MPTGDYRTYIFEKVTSKGDVRFYCRFFNQAGIEVTTRSLGKDVRTRRQAQFASVTLARTLELEALEDRKKNPQPPPLQDHDEHLRNVPFATFVVSFWVEGSSEYLRAERAAGRPLSTEYVTNRRRYAERFLPGYSPFHTPLRKLTFRMVEQFVTYLRDDRGLGGNQIEPIIRSLQKPVSWASSRGLLDAAFEWKAISLPETEYRSRGILSQEQVSTLLVMPVAPMRLVGEGEARRPLITFRKRLPGGRRQDGPGPIDIRVKAACALALLAGLRKGEIRGLRWSSVDFGNDTIEVTASFVRFEGSKAPKSGSSGTVPLPSPLKPILLELRKTALEMERFSNKGYVLFNSKLETPISETVLQRGFYRVLEVLGINAEVRKSLNLKFHGSRHFYATVLADEIGAAKAARLTRHSTATAFEDYANHLTPETLREAREALEGGLSRSHQGRQGEGN